MLTDYKVLTISRESDGSGYALVRFFEGDITTADEFQDEEMVAVTRYRRSSAIRESRISLDGRTDGELRDALNVILATDGTRTPIEEQRVA